MIKCGSCKESHETVAEVRNCYQVGPDLGQSATGPQLEFLSMLFRERGMDDLTLTETFTKQSASDWISDLVNDGRGPAVKPEYAVRTQNRVPSGRYATPSLTGNNDLDFWRVRIPEDGKWKGRCFIDRVIGGREDERLTRPQQASALAAIEAYGYQAAGELYGKTIGRCWACHRHLTDEISRAMGIGPDCAAERGIWRPASLEEAS